jgi:hypothetical protein
MSMFAAFEQAVVSVLTLPDVKRCIVVTSDEDTLQARQEEALSRTLLLGARDLARTLLAGGPDRRSEPLLGHLVVCRRFEDVAVAVIGGASLDEAEVQRKLNVVAIRVQVTTSKLPPSPLALALREDYVALAGPLSSIVFDRAMEELKRARKPFDEPTLRAFAEELAASLTPPTNVLVQKRFDETLRAWDASTTGAPKAGAPRSASPPPPLRRPTTVPRMAAVQTVVRDLVGPLGDLLVQRALESTNTSPSGPADAADAERLLTTIAAQLPAQHRPRFDAQGRAALENVSAPARARDDRRETDRPESSALDDQRSQRK